MRRLCALGAVACALAGCNWGKSTELPGPKETRGAAASDAPVFLSANAVGLDLSASLLTGSGKTVSPIAIVHTLSVLMNGTSNKARDELLTLLSTNESRRADYNASHRALLNDLQGTGFVTANALFAVWPMSLDEKYVYDMGALYDAGIIKLGSAGVGSTNVANRWFEAKTNDRASGVLELLTRKDPIIVFSVALFEGKVAERPEPKVYRDAGFAFVELALQDADFSLAVWTDDGSRPPSELGTLRALAKREDLVVSVPNIELSYRADLASSVASSGVPSLFNDDCNMRIVSIELERGYHVTRIEQLTSVKVTADPPDSPDLEMKGTLWFAVVHRPTGVVCVVGRS